MLKMPRNYYILSKFANSIIRNRLSFVHDIASVYRPSLKENKNKLIDIIKEKSEALSKSELVKKLQGLKGFYTLEMAPPGKDEMARLMADIELLKEFVKTNCFKFVTVKQALLLFLVGLEVALWFFIGETFGKFHLVGYKV